MRKKPKGKILKISGNIIFKQLDKDDGILLNLDTKNYYSLNETACFVVRSLIKGLSKGELQREIVKKFDAPVNKVRKDLDRIIDFLKKENVLLSTTDQ